MTKARSASTFEDVVVREAALRILFPAQAEDPVRSRAPRRWLMRSRVAEIRTAAEAIAAREPWRWAWE